MQIETVMERLGGVATAKQLSAHVEAPAIAAAVIDGTILRVARGRYQLPTADLARAAGNRLKGVVALRSAAAS